MVHIYGQMVLLSFLMLRERNMISSECTGDDQAANKAAAAAQVSLNMQERQKWEERKLATQHGWLVNGQQWETDLAPPAATAPWGWR